MVYLVSLPTTQKFESSSIKSTIMFYILIKSYQFEIASCSKCSLCDIHDEAPLYLFYVFMHRICGSNEDDLLQKKFDLAGLIPRSAIFGFVDLQDQNYFLFDHLRLICLYNTYNSSVSDNLNLQSLECIISGIKFMEEALSNYDINKMKNFK